VTASVLVVTGFFTGRLGRLFVMGLPIPGTYGLTNGFFDAFMGVIVAAKIRKFGAITLLGIIENAIKIMTGKPFYAVGPAIAGFLLADFFIWLVRRGNGTDFCLWPVGGILLGSRAIFKIAVFYLLGLPLLKIIRAHPLVSVWVILLSFAIGTLGSFLASQAVLELRRAGVIE